jgi:hypothetical protein
MGHARGVFFLLAGRAGIPVCSYSATRIKKSLTGVGHATKEQVARMLARILGCDSFAGPADVTDAVATALCHINVISHEVENDRPDTGVLVGIEDDQALVETGGLTYGVLVCPAAAEQLTTSGLVEREVILHTLYYIEGGIGLGGLTPRLIGFSSRADLDFFQQLTSVQVWGCARPSVPCVFQPGNTREPLS